MYKETHFKIDVAKLDILLIGSELAETNDFSDECFTK